MNNAWKKWMVAAKKVGNIQANILLFLVYFLIIFPLGFLFKLTNKFQIKPLNNSYWVRRKKTRQDLDMARKQ